MFRAVLDSFIALGELIDRVPAIVLIGVGVPMMLFGANWLVSGSVAIARRLGVSVLLIGLTIVAAGTSAPELAVNVIAALQGNPGISFGNVVGSNIANIGLIVAIGALIHPIIVHDRVVRQELPLLLAVSGGMVLVALAPWLGPEVPESPGPRVFGYGTWGGALLLLGFLGMSVWWYRLSRNTDDVPVVHEAEELVKQARAGTVFGAAALLVAGLAVLIIGGKFTEAGAVKTAHHFGLSEAVIGMTIVAIATSLPELVTTIVACRRGHTDLAVGNVVGSNMFNILLVLGLTASIADVPVPGFGGWQDLGAMMVLTALLWWFAGTHRRHVTRGEGGILLGLYVAYMTWGVLREIAA
jgi:cation:H+ antiporter